MSYLSNSVSRVESLKPFAKGLLSIFNFVIWKKHLSLFSNVMIITKFGDKWNMKYTCRTCIYIYSFKKVINLFKYFEKIEKSVNYFEIIFVLYQFVYFVQIYWNISINYKMYGQYMSTVFSMVVSIFRALWDMYVCRNNNNI